MGEEQATIEVPVALPADPEVTLEGETIGDGRFLLESVIGEGSLGRVYRAQEIGTEKLWAIKAIQFENPDAFHEQLQQEQKLLSISHNTIVARKDVLFENDRFFLVLEYIDGANLLERITSSATAMPEKAVVELALQLTDAIVYLHGLPEPIIFADLKPSKLLLMDSGEIKLLNFGIGNVKRPNEGGLGPASGTRGYVSPEQHKGQELDPRADIYSVGIVMHQMVSMLDPTEIRGELPRVNEAVPDIDRDLAKIISRATALDPKRRFPNAKQLRNRLSRLLEKWKLARPDARRLAVEWSGLTPRGGPLRTKVSEEAKAVHEQARLEREAKRREKTLAAVSAPEVEPDKSSNRLVLVGGAFLITAAYLARNGIDAADTFFYMMVFLVAFVFWGSS